MIKSIILLIVALVIDVVITVLVPSFLTQRAMVDMFDFTASIWSYLALFLAFRITTYTFQK